MPKHRIIKTKGQRVAWTNTSKVDDKEVIEAIKFVAAEIDLSRTVIHIKNFHRGLHTGFAYSYIPYEANLDGLVKHEWSYLVTVRVSGLTSWVNTLAHEAKHIEQFKRGTLRREKRQRNCEPQARAFGAWIEERWLAR